VTDRLPPAGSRSVREKQSQFVALSFARYKLWIHVAGHRTCVGRDKHDQFDLFLVAVQRTCVGDRRTSIRNFDERASSRGRCRFGTAIAS
jgi:hypothetical protein